MTSQSSEPACGACHKTQNQLLKPLKNCAGCRKQQYCSHECQKADWKNHKPLCSHSTSDISPKTTPSPNVAGGPCNIPKPFTAIENCTWLLNRPEKDVFKLLVDMYRMRIEDEYKFEGDVDGGCLYGGASLIQASQHFRKFLTKITEIDDKRDKKLLPTWWSPDKLSECVEFSLKDKDSNIGAAVEKHDIQDHYQQLSMPMQLRMFGERLDGTQTAGMSGASMLRMQLVIENGGSFDEVKNQTSVPPRSTLFMK